ncbi:MAG: DUF2007 domain-containing protein [Candidatus Kapabacteria bacterium]|nr:DUF2007 domain-containing protein [Candidatus Kapabacteria bacterium]
MIMLATFTNEIDAQLLESQLKSNGIDYRVVREDPTGVMSDTIRIMVFEDDIDEAREIMQSREMDDDDYLPGLGEDTDFDKLSDEDFG